IIAKVRETYRHEWTYGLHMTTASPAATLNDDEFEQAGSADPGRGSPPDGVTGIETHAELNDALDTLSATDRSLVQQLFYEGRTEAAVAEPLGISQRAVSKRLQAVLSKLRKALKTRHGPTQKIQTAPTAN